MADNLTSAYGRAFAALYVPGHPIEFSYAGNVKVDAAQRSAGSISPILNGSQVVSGLRSTPGLWTTQAANQLVYGEDSLLRYAYEQGIPIHLQVHYGVCNSPTDFADYSDVFLLENAYVTDYASTTLTTTAPNETAIVQETFTLAALDAYWTRKYMFGKAVTSTSVDGEVVSLVFSETKPSRIYCLIEQPPIDQINFIPLYYYIGWSDDNGITWTLTRITNDNGLLASSAELGKLVALGEYLVGINPLSSTKPIWTIRESSLGTDAVIYPYFPAGLGSYPEDIVRHGDYAYVAYRNGAIVRIDKHLTTEVYLSSGLSNTSKICLTEAGKIFLTTYTFPGHTKLYEVGKDTARLIGDFPANTYFVQMVARPDGYLLLSNINGEVYGKATDSDTLVQLFNSPSDCINQIYMVDNLLGYMCGAQVYQTLDGGQTWAILDKTNFPAADYRFVALLADKRRVLAGGLPDAGIACSAYTSQVGGYNGILILSR